MSEPLPSGAKKVGILAGMLLFVISGIRNKSISSKPIMLMSDDADEYPVTSLESEIWKALNKCGVTEKKQAEKPAKKKGRVA